MNFQEAVDALEGRVRQWADTFSSTASDVAAKAYRDGLVKERTDAYGTLLADERQLDLSEENWRRARDREATAEGNRVDLDVDLLAERLAQEVSWAEPLASLSKRYGGGSSEKGLQALLVDSVRERNIRDDVRGLTCEELGALYGNLKDDVDADNAAIRCIEDAVLGGRLESLHLSLDPGRISIDLPRLQASVRARRTARVPEVIRQAQAKLATVRTMTFRDSLAHLKSGRGIAYRPRPRSVAV